MTSVTGNKGMLISLAEPVNLVKLVFREHAISTLQNKKTVNVIDKVLNYNHVPFITALISDIFSDATRIDEIPPSTLILIEAGLDRATAEKLALSVFKAIINEITTFIPDVNFNEDGYRFNFCGEYDLHIATPYLNELTDNDMDNELLANR